MVKMPGNRLRLLFVPHRHARRHRGLSPLAPALARTVWAMVVIAWCLVAAESLLRSGLPPVVIAWSTACVAGLGIAQLVVGSGPRSPRTAAAVIVLQLLLLTVPFPWAGPPVPGLPGFVVGSLLLLLRPGAAIPSALLVVVAAVAVEAVTGTDAVGTAFAAIASLLSGLVLFAIAILVRLVDELAAARRRLDAAAAERERSRLARDVHDLLGLGLSAITLKCELALRLLPGDADLSRRQLLEVLTLARRSLADVRSVTNGHATLSFEQEVEHAQDALLAVDVQLTFERSVVAPPGATGTALAAALREGITNVLRHSDARWCRLGLDRDGGRVRMEITNDGSRAESPEPGAGNGLRNLAERVGALGGEVTTDDDGAVFRLVVTLPA